MYVLVVFVRDIRTTRFSIHFPRTHLSQTNWIFLGEISIYSRQTLFTKVFDFYCLTNFPTGRSKQFRVRLLRCVRAASPSSSSSDKSGRERKWNAGNESKAEENVFRAFLKAVFLGIAWFSTKSMPSRYFSKKTNVEDTQSLRTFLPNTALKAFVLTALEYSKWRILRMLKNLRFSCDPVTKVRYRT